MLIHGAGARHGPNVYPFDSNGWRRHNEKLRCQGFGLRSSTPPRQHAFASAPPTRAKLETCGATLNHSSRFRCLSLRAPKSNSISRNSSHRSGLPIRDSHDLGHRKQSRDCIYGNGLGHGPTPSGRIRQSTSSCQRSISRHLLRVFRFLSCSISELCGCNTPSGFPRLWFYVGGSALELILAFSAAGGSGRHGPSALHSLPRVFRCSFWRVTSALIYSSGGRNMAIAPYIGSCAYQKLRLILQGVLPAEVTTLHVLSRAMLLILWPVDRDDVFGRHGN